jgi:hypothetical protein
MPDGKPELEVIRGYTPYEAEAVRIKPSGRSTGSET